MPQWATFTVPCGIDTVSNVVRHLFTVTRSPPSPTLFPYTTLFRSRAAAGPTRWGRGCDRDRGRGAVLGRRRRRGRRDRRRSEEHTSELQSHVKIVCRLRLEKKNNSELQLGKANGSNITLTGAGAAS